MSLPNDTSKTDSTEAHLAEWGATERNTSPVRPGQFAALAGQLTRHRDTTAPVKSQIFSGLAWGGAAVAAVTLGIGAMLNQPQGREKARQVHTAQPATDGDSPRFTGMVTNAQTGEPLLADRGDKIAALAAPVFTAAGTPFANHLLGAHTYATVPFTVAVKNNGATFTGNVIVTTRAQSGTSSARRYIYPLQVPGNGTFTRTTVYAAVQTDSERSECTVELETPRRRVLLCTFDDSLGMNGFSPRRVVASIDKRLGVLATRRIYHMPLEIAVQNYYAKPVNAPDRASGYDAVDALVLGQDSEQMSAPQWEAIGSWVKRGGSLVLLGQGPGAKALQCAVAQELSPTMPDGQLKPGAIPLNLKQSILQVGNGSSPLAAFHTVGMGNVTLLRFDPTTSEFRSHDKAMAYLWEGVSNRAAHDLSAASLRASAFDNQWVPDVVGETHQPELNNPFLLQLPDLRTVTYIFLGYFVLVVPIAFVVLKQTRRLQYAWVTGPALAVLFAGGVGVMSLGLYRTPMSQRTAGVLVINAGDKEARFAGFSELFTPHGGTYRISLPGTDQVFDDQGKDYGYSMSNPNGSTLGSFTTQEMGTSAPLDINLPNLSFRRVFHQETVSLGQGITADLRMGNDGMLIGTITNSSGITLRNAAVLLRSTKTNPNNKNKFLPYLYKLGDISPGRTMVRAKYAAADSRYPNSQYFTAMHVLPILNRTSGIYWGISPVDQWTVSQTAPLLFAQTGGDNYGPQNFGRSVGGDSSVGVVVRLPVLSNVSATKGGDGR